MKYIPYEKLSKKKKREMDSTKRTTWSISPITRKPESSKAYNRRKARKIDFDDSLSSVLFHSVFNQICSHDFLGTMANAAHALHPRHLCHEPIEHGFGSTISLFRLAFSVPLKSIPVWSGLQEGRSQIPSVLFAPDADAR